MVLPTAGGEPREFLRAQDPVRIGVPAWTPDSRYIIYARTVMSVHPDGSRIAFTAGSGRGREVCVLKNLLPGEDGRE